MKMTQKSITNFFKPSNERKRKSDDQIDENKKICCHSLEQLNFEADNLMSKLNSKFAKAMSCDIGISWYQALKPEFSKLYFQKLNEFITNERKNHVVYPLESEVFSWTLSCNINQVKVIIIGQDPYHQPNQAHGLAFSVKKNVPLPPSLVNIFKEVKNDYPSFSIPKHGDLTSWAEQGVLLLNACLTVRANSPNSHSNHGWENFTDAVIKYLNDSYQNFVFMLWGSYAQKKGVIINQKKHLVLRSVHPSPLSAHRGFFGCSHFKAANHFLEKNALSPIDWTRI